MSSLGAKTPASKGTFGLELHRDLVLRHLSVQGAVLTVRDLKRRLPGLSVTEIGAAIESLSREARVESVGEGRYRVVVASV